MRVLFIKTKFDGEHGVERFAHGVTISDMRLAHGDGDSDESGAF